jgi:(R,R)-butanediol dehydrogenase / meso-butanediol dehydrogenase / diacetyl reductase
MPRPTDRPSLDSSEASGARPRSSLTETAALPEVMPAAVFMGLRDVRVEERPRPEIGADDVLIEVSHCGICGSDLHFLLEWGGHEGAIEGHEYSGTIVAVGDAVTGWSVGERVVGGPSPRCGTCEYCRAQRPSLCLARGRAGADDGAWQGAFARYKTIPAAQLLRIPDELTSKHAALAEPLAVALHGITRGGGPRLRTRWLVTGGGPIGFLSVAALRAAGVEDIVVSEPHESRRALCERLGASTVHPDELTTPPMPHDIVAEPFDVALECSGNNRAMEAALAQLKRGGTLVLVGAGVRAPRFDNNRILLNELVITGAFVYDHDGFPRALDLLASQDFPVDLLVEPEDIPLGGLLDAAIGLHEGKLAAKVMIVPRTD